VNALACKGVSTSSTINSTDQLRGYTVPYDSNSMHMYTPEFSFHGSVPHYAIVATNLYTCIYRSMFARMYAHVKHNTLRLSKIFSRALDCKQRAESSIAAINDSARDVCYAVSEAQCSRQQQFIEPARSSATCAQLRWTWALVVCLNSVQLVERYVPKAGECAGGRLRWSWTQN
jgi:hypothetical protein